jgi:hypothetical protein
VAKARLVADFRNATGDVGRQANGKVVKL